MSPPPEAFDRTDLALMWRVFGLWMGLPRQNHGSTLLRQSVAQFGSIDSNALQLRLPKSGLPLKLYDQGWIVGGPLPRRKPPVVPVVTVSLGSIQADRVTDAAFRVALLTEREEGTIEAHGWRFEQAETPTKPTAADPDPGLPTHPYCHAQAIVGWVKGCNCLIHPPHPEGEDCDGIDPGTNGAVHEERRRVARDALVSHPAFPLPATTLTGLSLSLVATLYGVSAAADIVSDSTLSRVAGQIRQDLESLRLFD